MSSGRYEEERRSGSQKAYDSGSDDEDRRAAPRSAERTSEDRSRDERPRGGERESRGERDYGSRGGERREERGERSSRGGDSRGPPPNRDNGNTVFVRNLSYSTQEESLKEHFKACGSIQSARIPTQNDTGRPRGFAFIEFADDAGVQEALRLDGTELDGRQIFVVVSNPSDGGGGGGRGGGRGGRRGGFGGGGRDFGGRGGYGGGRDFGDRGDRGDRDYGGPRGGDREFGDRGGRGGYGGERRDRDRDYGGPRDRSQPY